MKVGDEDGVEARHAAAEALLAEIGAGVDDDAAGAVVNPDAAAEAAVARVR